MRYTDFRITVSPLFYDRLSVITDILMFIVSAMMCGIDITYVMHVMVMQMFLQVM